ncbi:MAG: LapA family protein [Syntrophaceae bacterium]|nr:LapA family protein [Syntrophaceae bacterium]
MNAKLIGIIVLLIVLVFLGIQNYHPMKLKFLFWAFETSVVLVLLVSFVIGALVGGFLVWIGRAKKKDLSPLSGEKTES